VQKENEKCTNEMEMEDLQSWMLLLTRQQDFLELQISKTQSQASLSQQKILRTLFFELLAKQMTLRLLPFCRKTWRKSFNLT